MLQNQCTFSVCGDGYCNGQESLATCINDCGCSFDDNEYIDRSRIGDGYCDQDLNVDCCWDGGDCCQETCVPKLAACGSGASGFDTCHSPTLECKACLRSCNGHGVCNEDYQV